MIIFVILIIILPKNIISDYALYKNFEEISSRHAFVVDVRNVLQKNVDISSNCTEALKLYVEELQGGKPWAMEMFDAGGRIPSGIIAGNTLSMGAYEQCLEIVENVTQLDKVFGKYCLAKVSTEAILHYPLTNMVMQNLSYQLHHKWVDLGVCIPSSCSSIDAQKLYQSIIGPGFVNFKKDLCQINHKLYDGKALIGIAFLSLFAFLIVASTLYDVFLRSSKRECSFEHLPDTVLPILRSFSLLSNGRRLLSVNNDPRQLSFLHGLRLITLGWIVFANTFLVTEQLPIETSGIVLKWITEPFYILVLRSALAFDTLLLISSLLLSYTFMKMKSEGKGFNIGSYCAYRYIRITPPIAALIIIVVTLSKHFGTGPMWKATIENNLTMTCNANWWKTLIYINNFDSLTNSCIKQSWYLALDYQFYVLSLFIMIPLSSKPKLTLTLLACLALLSTMIGAITIWENDNFLRHLLNNLNHESIVYFHTKPWTRALPWLAGLALGYYIYNIKQRHYKLTVKRHLVWLMWTITLAILCACISGNHSLLLGQRNKLVALSFLVLTKLGWTFGIAWVIFACASGNAGKVNWFLSSRMCQALSKLGFSLYLTHLVVINVLVAQIKDDPKFSSNFYMLNLFWGSLVYSLIIAFFFLMAFELPILNIIRHILARKEEDVYLYDGKLTRKQV